MPSDEPAGTPPRQRPEWWPDGEPWPPAEWRGPPWWGRRGGPGGWHGPAGPPWRGGPWRGGPWRGGLARRFGCFVLLLATLLVSSGTLVLWLLGSLLGVVGADGPLLDLARTAGLVVLVAGVAALILGIRLARGVGPPLGDLVEAAQRVEAGDYSVRVPVAHRGPAELRDLGRAFNTMTARLEVDEDQRRRLLADVSHELRTPLAVIQGNLEGLVDGVYPADDAHLAPILDETRVLSRLIEDLRTLSLAEAGALWLHRESTDLGILAGEVVRSFAPQADRAGVSLEADVADDVPLLEVDPIRIREVLANLLANALRYLSRGGTVRLTARSATGRVELEVVDDGPGIPPDLLPTVFDRFARSADSRGSGLGLAIARAIVTAHGGTIEATSAPGAGTTIRIELPNG